VGEREGVAVRKESPAGGLQGDGAGKGGREGKESTFANTVERREGRRTGERAHLSFPCMATVSFHSFKGTLLSL